MTAKQQVIEFLQTARKTPGGKYSFIFSGSSAQAFNFVQAMRTELSRLRKQAAAEGRTVNKFKMLLESIDAVPDMSHQWRINLRFANRRGITKQVANDLDAIFGDMIVDEPAPRAAKSATALPRLKLNVEA